MAEDKRLEDGQGDQGPYVPPEQQNGHHDEPGEQDPLMVILKCLPEQFLSHPHTSVGGSSIRSR